MVNKNKLFVPFLLLISFISSSCFSNQSDNSLSENPSANNDLLDSLLAKQWQIQTYQQKTATNTMFMSFSMDTNAVDMNKKKGKVSGFSGCNRFFGSFVLGGNNLSFGPLAGTRKMCAKTMSFESNVLSSLATINNYKIINNSGVISLYLYDANKQVFSFNVK